MKSQPRSNRIIRRTITIADRGPRPAGRGWYHLVAAVLSLIAGSVLATFAWLHVPWLPATGVTIYALALVLLFGVSAAYHRGLWKSHETVQWWRRADHSTIAVFIAATYTPLCLLALDRGRALWVLAIAWSGALLSVLLNMVWTKRPRWLRVLVYLVLGWLIVPLVPELWVNAGPTVVWLLFAGGVIYSVGALMYGLRWPGRNATYLGFHEHFHAATIVAAVVHCVAIWMVVA